MSDLTQAEVGLKRNCNRCKRMLYLDSFYVSQKNYLTEDGRRRRFSICKDCHNDRTSERSRNTTKRGSAELEKATKRAKTRLARAFPEAFDMLLAEELRKDGFKLSDFRRNRSTQGQFEYAEKTMRG